MQKNKTIENIVIFRTDRIGEVLLSTISIDAVKKKYPSAKISFITSSYSKPLLEDRPDLETLDVFDTYEKGKIFLRAIRLASVLRKKKADIAVILNPHKILHLGCFLAGIRLRLGYNRKWGRLLNLRIDDKRTEGKKHEAEYTMDLLRLLDVNMPTGSPSLFISDNTRKRVNSILDENGRSAGKPLISIHPGSSNPSKIWPADKYSRLIDKIRSGINSDVAVLGSAEENDLVKEIIDGADHEVIDLSGKLSLKELSAVIDASSVFIGNDAGPTHMAAALNVPVIAVFGKTVPGTNPARWRPWTDSSVIFHETGEKDSNMDLSGGYKYVCSEQVDPEDVFASVKQVMGV